MLENNDLGTAFNITDGKKMTGFCFQCPKGNECFKPISNLTTPVCRDDEFKLEIGQQYGCFECNNYTTISCQDNVGAIACKDGFNLFKQSIYQECMVSDICKPGAFFKASTGEC